MCDKDGVDLRNFLSTPYQSSQSSPLSTLRLGPPQPLAPEQLPEPQHYLQQPPLSQRLDIPGKRSNIVYDTSTPPSSPPTRRHCPNPAGPTDRPAGNVPSSLSTTDGPAQLELLGGGINIDNPPPFRWAADHPAHIHPIDYLVDNGLHSVEGQVKCSGCGRYETVVYDVRAKFEEISRYVREHVWEFNDRALEEWKEPGYKAECRECGKGMKAVVAESRERINWLFLFLGEGLAHCKSAQLKWYLEQHGLHRSGSRERLLYYSYISIGSQLQPSDGIFYHLLPSLTRQQI